MNRLLEGVEYEIIAPLSEKITNITHKAEQCARGWCYICLIGTHNGHNYVTEAAEKGAAAVIIERSHCQSVMAQLALCNTEIGIIAVSDTRKAYGIIAANYYCKPSESIKLIGVTGTNGKTTTCKIIYDLLRGMGKRVGLIGTVCNCIGAERLESTLTTPDPMQLNELLRAMVDCGCEYAVAEVSAHAIALDKISGIRFSALGFTNLSQDHLDYFGDMDTYKAAKTKLFIAADCPIAVNADDACGYEILHTSTARQKYSYSVIDTDCNLTLFDNSYAILPISAIIDNANNAYSVNFESRMYTVQSRLQGKFNVYNTLCAIGLLVSVGLDIDEVIGKMPLVKSADGRFETKQFSNGVRVIIDYAHSPDGMEKVLSEARAITSGSLICVFGCGGERDEGKRPIMGRISSEIADTVIITSDNPRFESRDKIMRDIYSGVVNIDKIVMCRIRYHAILYALKRAKSGDTVIILGKGHENYIEENGIKIEYSDVSSVEKILDEPWRDGGN